MPEKPIKRTNPPAGKPSLAPARKPGGSSAPFLKKSYIAGGAAVGAVAVLAIVGVLFTSGNRNASERSEPNESDGSSEKPRRTAEAKRTDAGPALEPPKVKTLACRVYTPEPGFYVLIDGEPVRNERGKKLTTPLEVGIPPGNHKLSVLREKYREYSEEVLISRGRTFEIAPTYEPFAEPGGFLASRLGMARLGQPVELKNLNAGGPAWDPFVTSDGLTLLFAGQKSAGKGIYLARRETIFDEFDAPELIIRNSDRVASPSMTDDRLLVAYAVHDKPQIRGLVRVGMADPFKQSNPPLRTSEREDEIWPSAQIGPDGKTLYYVQQREGAKKATTHVTTRKSRGKPFDGKARSITVPGGHLRMTRDGLRQYLFDGQKVFRSTRADVEDPFSSPEELCELELNNFTPRADYRQYVVSDDEQWLYYCDDPEESGKLYAVRIAEGPAWGYSPRGKPIAQKEMAQSSAVLESAGGKEPDGGAAMKPPAVEPPPVDSRSLPLPYAEFRAKLDQALAAYNYGAAEELVGEAQKDPRLAKDKAPLEWDLEEVQRLRRFWKRLDAAIGQLKSGEVLRAGSVQIEFAKFEEGAISGKVKGSDKTISRSLQELTPQDLVAIVDKSTDRNDREAQLEVLTFLARSPKVGQQLVNARLERAGPKGKTVLERQDLRKLHLIEQEIDRGNISLGLQMIDQMIAAAPRSTAVPKAQALRESLYTRTEWRAVGRQNWDKPAPGEYATTLAKSENSYLISPGEYGNFVLSLEWKTTGDTAQGGVFFHFRITGDIRKNAFKIHLANDYALRDRPDRFSTGSLFKIKGPRSNPVKPAGQWNTLVLRVIGDRIQATINGVEVLDTPASDVNVAPSGYICLDGEFGGISYRKILTYEVTGQGAGKK